MPYFVRSASLINYVEVARSVGLEPNRLLRAEGISSYALLDPDSRIPVDAVGRLLEASAREAGIEDFGLRMAQTRQLSNLGPLAMAVREEPTLRRAMEAMARYMRLHNEALVTRVEEAEGLVMIREDLIDQAAVPLRQSTELVIGVLFRTLQLFLGAGWKPRSICFTHGPPASTATHRRLFGMPVLFHQEFDGIVCRAAELETPLPGYDAAIAQQVRQYMDAMLAQSSSSMADKVRELVLAMLPLGICSVERIAGQLDVDRRTVHHHLSARGESYSSILNAVRVDLVVRYIENRERPLSEVATLLGFASLSAFSRWFGGQFGCSVSKWRTRQGR
ncbi:AraC family transcriptional regulator [Cupriavidus sp. USMAA2-4]|uniref:AraC family transcriptional regulator n=1 Tax=unclassified Cupriavidus TaxID=2640874 RepID=UPI0008A6AE4F|nr:MULTISPECIES: AraC family transcriptional regulator [unclassified Cupriavidus]AOY96409.1 AraC family transcriptional regulator [Cupriavidus sp. USMAA2-4]AOZ03192.1 AraC family transcriptional regulator [Cupriavidus sp. USMAHM13]